MEPRRGEELEQTRQPRSGRLRQLDALRGVAACTVIFSHLLASTAQWHVWDLKDIFELTPFRIVIAGRAAVALFFILSGFVLALPYFEGRRDTYAPYAVRRFFRIYAPYLVTVIASFTLFLAFSRAPVDGMSDWFNRHWSEPLTPTKITKHLFLVGNFDAGQYGLIFWTLVHEMRVSLLFPLVMLPVIRLRSGIALLPAIALSVLGALSLYARGRGIVGSTDYAVTAFFLLLFSVGALMAKHRTDIVESYKNSSIGRRRALVGVSLALCLYGWLAREIEGGSGRGEAYEYWILTLGGAGLLAWVVASEGAARLFARRALVWLGDVSYSLYLWHAVILYTLVHVFYGSLPLPILLAAVVPTSVAVAALSFRYVEVPAMQAGRHAAHVLRRRAARPRPIPEGVAFSRGAEMVQRLG